MCNQYLVSTLGVDVRCEMHEGCRKVVAPPQPAEVPIEETSAPTAAGASKPRFVVGTKEVPSALIGRANSRTVRAVVPRARHELARVFVLH